MERPVHIGARTSKSTVRLLSAFVLVPALLLLSCAFFPVREARPASAGPDGLNKITPDGGRVLAKVPFYPQKKYQCGPAALAEVLNYYGAKTTPDTIARDIYSKTARGTLDLDMPFYANRAGFAASQYHGSASDIKREIDRGRPLIVLLDYGFWVYQHGHYMVVTGYDKKGIIAHTGERPFEHIAWGDFLPPWEKTGCWTLLIKKTPKKAPSAGGNEVKNNDAGRK